MPISECRASVAALLLFAGFSCPAVGGSHLRAMKHPPLTAQKRHALNLLLDDADRRNDYVRFRALLAAGANPNSRQLFNESNTHTQANSTSWLMQFATLGDAQTVKALLDHGADVNARGLSRGHRPGDLDPHGSTALIDACSRGDNWDVIQLLLDHGTDINARDWGGSTPLGMAVWQSDWDECDLLLRHGARPKFLHPWQRQTLAEHSHRSI